MQLFRYIRCYMLLQYVPKYVVGHSHNKHSDHTSNPSMKSARTIVAMMIITCPYLLVAFSLDTYCISNAAHVFTPSIGQSERLFSFFLHMTPGASSSTVQAFFTSAGRS